MRPAMLLGAVVFVAALFMIVSAQGMEYLQTIFVATAVGILFVVAAALMSGSLRVQVVREGEPEGNSGSDLQAVAARYGVSQDLGKEDVRDRILNQLWEEHNRGGRVEPLDGPSAQLLVEQLATPRPAIRTSHIQTFNRRTLRLLVQEAKSLNSLARLFHVEPEPYGRMLTKARHAMRIGNLEGSIQMMQFANDQLRARLEEQVTEEW